MKERRQKREKAHLRAGRAVQEENASQSTSITSAQGSERGHVIVPDDLITYGLYHRNRANVSGRLASLTVPVRDTTMLAEPPARSPTKPGTTHTYLESKSAIRMAREARGMPVDLPTLRLERLQGPLAERGA